MDKSKAVVSEMDENEAVAYRFLRTLEFSPHHEPRGHKTFPDFEVDGGAIGIEVRAFMQSREGEPAKPLASENESIRTQTKELLASIERADLPTSYWVRVQFTRPLPKWRKIETAIRAHLAGPVEKLRCSHLPITENVSISVVPIDENRETPFLSGANQDLQNTRFDVASMIESIRHAIDCKTEIERNLANCCHGYDRLWLILVNRIDNHLTREEVDEIRTEVIISPPWERIIVIDPDATMLMDWVA